MRLDAVNGDVLRAPANVHGEKFGAAAKDAIWPAVSGRQRQHVAATPNIYKIHSCVRPRGGERVLRRERPGWRRSWPRSARGAYGGLPRQHERNPVHQLC